MSDAYLNFANSAFGARLAGMLGLPRPVPLERFEAGQPVVAGDVLVGAGGTPELLPALLAAFKDKLQRLGEVVQAGPYLAGAQPSLADCGFAVTLPLAQRLLNSMGEDLALPDALSPWTLALEQDEAAQAALAPWRLATESWLQAANLKGTRT